MGCKDSYVQGPGLCDIVIVRFLQGRNSGIFLSSCACSLSPGFSSFRNGSILSPNLRPRCWEHPWIWHLVKFHLAFDLSSWSLLFFRQKINRCTGGLLGWAGGTARPSETGYRAIPQNNQHTQTHHCRINKHYASSLG